ncbi:MAG: hypothetical protein ABSH48_02790 [Verrucomicrobiota bacterium]|jgi:hypothetical protein
MENEIIKKFGVAGVAAQIAAIRISVIEEKTGESALLFVRMQHREKHQPEV